MNRWWTRAMFGFWLLGLISFSLGLVRTTIEYPPVGALVLGFAAMKLAPVIRDDLLGWWAAPPVGTSDGGETP